MRVSVQNVQTNHQEDLKKIRKIHSSIWQLLIKKLMCFETVAAAFVITMGKRICSYLYGNFSCNKILYLFESTFLEFGLISSIIFMKEFISLTMVAVKIGKRQFLSYHSNGCYDEESFIKNLNPIDSNYHSKNWLDWFSVGWDKISQPKKCKFLEKGRKS